MPSPLEPSPHRSFVILGFLGMLLVFIGIFYFIFEGDLTLKTLDTIDYAMGIVSIVALPYSAYLTRKMWKHFWGKGPEKPDKYSKTAKFVQSKKSIGLMTGVGYFFLAIIGLLIIIPVIALVVMSLTGNL